MEFDIDNIEQRKNLKNSRVTKTINKNLETYQYPHYDQHKSLIGFCNMNYSRVKQNAEDIQYMKNERQDIGQSLDTIYQDQFKRDFYSQNQVKQPFNQVIQNNRIRDQDLKNDIVMIQDDPNVYNSYIQDKSKFVLRNSTMDYKIDKIRQENDYYEKFNQYKPVDVMLQSIDFGQSEIPQVQSVQYKEVEKEEKYRHFQSLSDKIITEQSLQQLLNEKLTDLDIQNHNWIPLNLISKIGFLAKNIVKLNLGGLSIIDEILVELSISCNYLSFLNISNCNKLTEKGVKDSLSNLQNRLIDLNGYGNADSFTNQSLEPLEGCTKLMHIDIGYCYKKNQDKINLKQYLQSCKGKLQSLHISGCKNIDCQDICDIITDNAQTLVSIDISFITHDELNRKFMREAQKCQNIEYLDLGGCQQFQDESISLFANSEKRNLQYLNFSSISDISDNSLIKLINQSPYLKYLNLNGNHKVNDHSVQQICKLAARLQILNINNTPEVALETIDEILQNRNPNLIPIKILKNVHNPVDPKFNGLLMPFISVSKQQAIIKKKKKKKKK